MVRSLRLSSNAPAQYQSRTDNAQEGNTREGNAREAVAENTGQQQWRQQQQQQQRSIEFSPARPQQEHLRSDNGGAASAIGHRDRHGTAPFNHQPTPAWMAERSAPNGPGTCVRVVAIIVAIISPKDTPPSPSLSLSTITHTRSRCHS